MELRLAKRHVAVRPIGCAAQPLPVVENRLTAVAPLARFGVEIVLKVGTKRERGTVLGRIKQLFNLLVII